MPGINGSNWYAGRLLLVSSYRPDVYENNYIFIQCQLSVVDLRTQKYDFSFSFLGLLSHIAAQI